MATWTAEEIAALRAAIASGTLSVSYSSGGTSRQATYHSLEQMIALLAQMEGSLDPADGGRARFRRVVHNRGFRGRNRSSFRRNE